MKKHEHYWREVVAGEIESLKLPRTDRKDVILGYSMAIADAVNTARKWGATNRLEPLDDDLPPVVQFPRWPERTEN